MSSRMTYWNGLLVTVEQWAALQRKVADCEHGYSFYLQQWSGKIIVQPLTAAQSVARKEARWHLSKELEWWTEEAQIERAERNKQLIEQAEANEARRHLVYEGGGRPAGPCQQPGCLSLLQPARREWGLSGKRLDLLGAFAPWWEDPDVQTAAEVLNG